MYVCVYVCMCHCVCVCVCRQIEQLRRCEIIKESEVKALCAKARYVKALPLRLLRLM